MSSPQKRGSIFPCKTWIPAFAGMTNQDLFRHSLDKKNPEAKNLGVRTFIQILGFEIKEEETLRKNLFALAVVFLA